MFPFWEVVIAPVLEAAGARRIVEIGALRGENTELMLDRLGPEAELHVIDPVPDFDPAEHERRFAGQYVFHRDLSLNVLGDLPPMDAALIDGDHNWYTVYNELRLLARGRPGRGRAAAGADPPRRGLALRPARPLLRAPRRSPRSSASRGGGRACGPDRKRLLPDGGGLNPTHVQRRARGRPAQRRDDRARRLHRRARPAAAAASSCRSTSAWPSSSRRSGSRASPSSRPSSTASRAPRARTSCSSLAEDIRSRR